MGSLLPYTGIVMVLNRGLYWSLLIQRSQLKTRAILPLTCLKNLCWASCNAAWGDDVNPLAAFILLAPQTLGVMVVPSMMDRCQIWIREAAGLLAL